MNGQYNDRELLKVLVEIIMPSLEAGENLRTRAIAENFTVGA